MKSSDLKDCFAEHEAARNYEGDKFLEFMFWYMIHFVWNSCKVLGKYLFFLVMVFKNKFDFLRMESDKYGDVDLGLA